MKKRLIIAAMITCTVIIKNNYGVQMGTIGTDGAVRDNYGVYVGSVSPDGTIKDTYGVPQGTLDGTGCVLPDDNTNTDKGDE